VDRGPERVRTERVERALPRDVDTWEDFAAVRRALALGASGRWGAYPPM
jgi:hypothetical protein